MSDERDTTQGVTGDAQGAPPAQPGKPTGLAALVHDVQRLWSLAVKLGAILAVVCHLLPPHYRAPCDVLASICRGHGGN